MQTDLRHLLIPHTAPTDNLTDDSLLLRVAEHLWDSGRFRVDLLSVTEGDGSDAVIRNRLTLADAVLIPVEPGAETCVPLRGWVHRHASNLRHRPVGLVAENRGPAVRNALEMLETALAHTRARTRHWQLSSPDRTTMPGLSPEALYAWVADVRPAHSDPLRPGLG